MSESDLSISEFMDELLADFPGKKHAVLMELVENIIGSTTHQSENRKYGTAVGIYVKDWLNVLIEEDISKLYTLEYLNDFMSLCCPISLTRRRTIKLANITTTLELIRHDNIEFDIDELTINDMIESLNTTFKPQNGNYMCYN